MLAINAQIWGCLLEYHQPTRDHNIKENWLSLPPKVILLPIAPPLRVESPEPLPNAVLRADWLDTVQVWCGPLQLLWLHECRGPAMSVGLFHSLWPFIHPWALHVYMCVYAWLCPCMHVCLRACYIEVSFVVEHSTDTRSLHHDQLCVSVLTTRPLHKENSLMWSETKQVPF